MEHETVDNLAVQSLHPLLIPFTAERRRNQGLRLATGKKGGAVSPGKVTGFTGYFSNLIKFPAADSDLAINDLIAHIRLFIGREQLPDFTTTCFFRINCSYDLLL